MISYNGQNIRSGFCVHLLMSHKQLQWNRIVIKALLLACETIIFVNVIEIDKYLIKALAKYS